nr:hypothetical protein [Candidatus Chloroploca sp. Khr17]
MQCVAIQVASDEDELVGAWIAAPCVVRATIEEHMHALKDKAARVVGNAQHALHAEDVGALLAQQPCEPGVQPLWVKVSSLRLILVRAGLKLHRQVVVAELNLMRSVAAGVARRDDRAAFTDC